MASRMGSCLIVAFFLLSGCARPGAKPTDRAALHPVSGTLTVNGIPAADAMIAFHPLIASDPATARPVALTDANGAFQLMTHVPGDGAPAGEYAVTVVWPDRSIPLDECLGDLAHDRLRERYADPAKTPWRIEVVAGNNDVSLEIYEGWSATPRRLLEPKSVKKQPPRVSTELERRGR